MSSNRNVITTPTTSKETIDYMTLFERPRFVDYSHKTFRALLAPFLSKVLFFRYRSTFACAALAEAVQFSSIVAAIRSRARSLAMTICALPELPLVV